METNTKSSLITILLLLVEIFGVISDCPQLKPNKNVLVTCYIGNGPTRQLFPCNPRNGQLSPGTTALYKCQKYFKPTSRRLNSGKLHCEENGEWTGIGGFTGFLCEIDCGKRPAFQTGLISFGEETTAENWPWVATIFRKTKKGVFKYSCGATLIGLRAVLTAAHCVTDLEMNTIDKSEVKVFLGSVSSDFEENVQNGASMLSAGKIHVNPDYHAESLLSDNAVIELVQDVTLSNSVIPICLPLSYDHDALVLSTGNAGQVASFGTDSTGSLAKSLQHGNVSILSNADCYSKIKVIPRNEQFCAGNEVGPKLCRGDSGSGMVFKSIELYEDKYVVHGIVSNTGDLSGGCGQVIVFCKVFPYIGWIHDILIRTESAEAQNSGGIQPQQQDRQTIGTTQKPTSTTSSSVSIGCPNGNAWCHQSPQPPSRPEASRPVAKPQLRPIGPAPKYTRIERQALDKMRPLVENNLLEDYMHRDEYLIKFLRSKNLSVDAATNLLEENIAWRKSNQMDRIISEDFSKFTRDYPIFFNAGVDKSGRPVVISMWGMFNLKKIVDAGQKEQFQRYLMRNCEISAKKVRDVGLRNVSQSLVIFDMYGFVSRQQICYQCLSIYSFFFKTHEMHFPQENSAVYFINIPSGFNTILQVIQPFFSEYTRRTIHFYGTKKEMWSAELLKHIPRDQLFIAYGGTKKVPPEFHQ